MSNNISKSIIYSHKKSVKKLLQHTFIILFGLSIPGKISRKKLIHIYTVMTNPCYY
jgi:hypothetical protein